MEKSGGDSKDASQIKMPNETVVGKSHITMGHGTSILGKSKVDNTSMGSDTTGGGAQGEKKLAFIKH